MLTDEMSSLVPFSRVISATNIGGTIPEGLMRSPVLSNLDLSQGRLHGCLTYSPSPTLVSLRVGNNNLSCMTVDEDKQGGFPELTRLNIESNAFVQFPPLHLMPALWTLHMTSNLLTGELPAAIGQMTNLTQLFAAQNQISGAFPDLSSLRQLQSVVLVGNSLTSFPYPINARTLEVFELSFNNLSGTLPPFVSTQLHRLYVLLSPMLCHLSPFSTHTDRSLKSSGNSPASLPPTSLFAS